MALANEKGKLLKRYAEPVYSPDEPAQTIARIGDAMRTMLSGVDRAMVKGVGVAVAGLVMPETGVLLTSPNLPAWYNTALKSIWEQELQLPVWVCNDASLAALGEYRFGAGRGVDNLVYITVSTGIGGGVIAGGRLLLGASGFAGEVGHMTIDVDGPVCNCGNVGCLEVLASGTAISRLAADRLSDGETSVITDVVGGDYSKVTASIVAEAAASGDGMAREIMHTAATNLGIGVVNLVHLFNPELVIIGGGVSRAGDLIFEPVRKVVAERKMPDIEVQIIPAGLGDDPGLLGAVALVLDNTSG